MTLKYLGEKKRDDAIKGAVVFSVPCNLRDSAEQLRLKSNRFYEQRFLKKLVIKIKEKAKVHEEVDGEVAGTLKDFDEFHDLYTAPLHGFESKEDFFSKSTCDQFLENIIVPTLIVNAANDPMLGDKCYPIDQASKNNFLYLEIPKKGGHVGFTLSGKVHSYMEVRAAAFIRERMDC